MLIFKRLLNLKSHSSDNKEVTYHNFYNNCPGAMDLFKEETFLEQHAEV